MTLRTGKGGRYRYYTCSIKARQGETDLRLKRLYDAIETGVADLNAPALTERIAGLKATRDQAQADPARAGATLESSGQAIPPAMLRKFARTARERVRIDGGGYRRNHYGRWPSASRSRMARSASWDRRATCSGRSPPPRA